jgi:hemerythrin-like domain-containing protein
MVREHCILENALDNLEENAKFDFGLMVKSFNNFEWKLEKHIFMEEKVIYTEYEPSDVTEDYKILPKLTEQHNYILNILNNWRNDIKNKRILKNIYSFKKYIIEHKTFEENEVYTRLDQELSDEQKKQMIDKITEII